MLIALIAWIAGIWDLLLQREHQTAAHFARGRDCSVGGKVHRAWRCFCNCWVRGDGSDFDYCQQTRHVLKGNSHVISVLASLVLVALAVPSAHARGMNVYVNVSLTNAAVMPGRLVPLPDRKSTRLNSSH